MNPRRALSIVAFALAANTSVASSALAQGAAASQGARSPLAPTGDPYQAYDALLRAVVRRSGVDYRALRARLPELRAFCDWLAENGPTATPTAFATADSKLAYWLNAYNATVLRAIAESPASMRNVLESMPNSGFFRTRTHRIDRRSMTLDALENREVRERFSDARVHAALNCGARSCPPLAAQAFRPRTVQAQLDRLATAWVNNGAVSLDASARALRVSSLFQWFSSDFTRPVRGRAVLQNGAQGPMRFVQSFAAPALRSALEGACGADLSRCRVEHVAYDWSLNEAR
ncbi:MAG: DUF547 domain-containing protein [Myxococcales bacterium]|nr:DUF547 domain-containing protein [Myxococcales bacterium]